MKIRLYILIVLILLAAVLVPPAMAGSAAQDREQKIKAAFLYNFINFVDWPEDKMTDNDEPIIIGVIGNKDFVNAFDPIKDKQIRGKKIVIKYFKDLKDLKKCHVVLLCICGSTSPDNSKKIMDAVKNFPVLTVGEQADFLENGGNINFLTVDHKIRFEINLDSAKRNNLKIRSKLLKLAKRVINEEKPEGAKS
jgi:hypothetical protein